MNGASVVGSLTWNANGSLNQLAVTDPFNATNAQTCNYGYDGLARISSANCGSAWSQTFGLDAFGNLSKTRTISFQPTYNPSTNRVSQVGSVTPGYDANGNLTNDGVHSYAWDAGGKVVNIDTTVLIYDALGRMVEQQRACRARRGKAYPEFPRPTALSLAASGLRGPCTGPPRQP